MYLHVRDAALERVANGGQVLVLWVTHTDQTAYLQDFPLLRTLEYYCFAGRLTGVFSCIISL